MLMLWNNAHLITVFLLCPNINKIILEDSVDLKWVFVLPKITSVISARTHKRKCDFSFLRLSSGKKLLVEFSLKSMVAYYYFMLH